jgi:hypothetical protein
MVGDGVAQVASPYQGDVQLSIHFQYFPELLSQVFDLIASALFTKFAKVREVLADLGGTDTQLIGQFLRGYDLPSFLEQKVQSSQIDG